MKALACLVSLASTAPPRQPCKNTSLDGCLLVQPQLIYCLQWLLLCIPGLGTSLEGAAPAEGFSRESWAASCQLKYAAESALTVHSHRQSWTGRAQQAPQGRLYDST